MELKPGYKQTDVGSIPNDWDTTRLGDKTRKVGSGITPTGGQRVYKEEGRPFLRSQNVGWGALLMDDIAFIDDETHETFKATEIETDDVFLNITGASIGRSAVADARVARGNVNQHVCIIRTNQEQLHPRFLNYFLLSSAGQQQIESFQAGGNRQGLNFGQIRSFHVPLPPLPEQRAIAAALSHVDALIGALDKLIAKKRDLKQAAMQQLLTGKQRLPGFTEEWEVKRFDELFQFLRTGHNPWADLSAFGNVSYIHYGDIHTTPQAFLDCSEAKLPLIEETKVAGLLFLEDGDLVMADASEDYAGIGKCLEICHVSGRKIVAGLHTFLLRGNRERLADGFKGYLQFIPSVKASLIRLATGISVYGVSKNNVKSIEVFLPLVDEQRGIAAVLSDMDAEIAALERKRDKTRLLKQGMMQELLTGRIRLPMPADEEVAATP